MHASKFIACITLILISISFPALALDDPWLKKMSDKLASAKAFSFRTTETHDRLSPNGKKNLSFSRTVLVRRPNRIHTTIDGKKDWNFWYDGKFLTGVSDQDKVYIQASMPETIDDSMDEMADRFDLNMPMSDILYSSPYDAFVSK